MGKAALGYSMIHDDDLSAEYDAILGLRSIFGALIKAAP